MCTCTYIYIDHGIITRWNYANLNNVYGSNATLGLFIRGPRWELVPSAPRVWWLRFAAPPPPVCSRPHAIPMSTF